MPPPLEQCRSLRDRLHVVRGLSGLNCSELSRRCGFPRQYVAMIEGGARSEIGPSKLVALVTVLGLSLDWLILGVGEAPTRAGILAALQHVARDPSVIDRQIALALGPTLAPKPTHKPVRAASRPKRSPAKRAIAKPALRVEKPPLRPLRRTHTPTAEGRP